MFEPWLLDVLLRWHAADPVGDKERQRNEAIFAIQRNRNPYVDHPEYVEMIWGKADGTMCDMVTSVSTTMSPAIRCYPSPAHDLLRFTEISLGDIRVYDLAGRLVMQASSLENGELAIDQLAAGQYLLHCEETISGQQVVLRFGKF